MGRIRRQEGGRRTFQAEEPAKAKAERHGLSSYERARPFRVMASGLQGLEGWLFTGKAIGRLEL